MNRVTVKSSTIFISVGERTRVYRSVEEVPPMLRKKLEQSTNSLNSATILIADRRGREEIVRAVRGLPSSVRSRLTSSFQTEKPEPPRPAERLQVFCRNWAEILLPGAIGLAVWLLFSMK